MHNDLSFGNRCVVVTRWPARTGRFSHWRYGIWGWQTPAFTRVRSATDVHKPGSLSMKVNQLCHFLYKLTISSGVLKGGTTATRAPHIIRTGTRP